MVNFRKLKKQKQFSVHRHFKWKACTVHFSSKLVKASVWSKTTRKHFVEPMRRFSQLICRDELRFKRSPRQILSHFWAILEDFEKNVMKPTSAQSLLMHSVVHLAIYLGFHCSHFANSSNLRKQRLEKGKPLWNMFQRLESCALKLHQNCCKPPYGAPDNKLQYFLAVILWEVNTPAHYQVMLYWYYRVSSEQVVVIFMAQVKLPWQWYLFKTPLRCF